MRMNPSTLSTLARPRRTRRAFRFLIVLPLALLVGYYCHRHYADQKDLEAASAETDRLEPNGWSVEAIEAQQPNIPDEQNAAVQIAAVRKRFPLKWPAVDQKPSPLQTISGAMQLSDQHIAELRADFRSEPGARVVEAARRLADLPHGQSRVRWGNDLLGPMLDNEQQARYVVNVLGYDAILRAQEGDLDGACRSCRAILNVGRVVGRSPTLISYLVCCAIHRVACAKVERVLAQGQPAAAALAELQRVLEQADQELSLLPALRGERAGIDRAWRAMQEGKTSASLLSLPSLGSGVHPPIDTQSLARSRALLLRYMNRAIAIAQLPTDQQVAEFKLLAKSHKDLSSLPAMILPAVDKLADAHRRAKGCLSNAVAAVAVERYRRKYGRWPDTLDALVSEFLPSVPIDVSNGQPLWYGRDKDSVAAGIITLWDPDSRRKPYRVERNPNAAGSDQAP
jgi:hypothetical protein